MRRSIRLLTLQCVLVIAEEGSFLAASTRLNMHHTALSRRVRDLELTLGVTLFDRHSGGVRPTAVGTRFLANLRRVLTDLDGMISSVGATGRGEAGQLMIGIDAPLPACGYVDAVVAFVRDRPDVDVRFTEASRADLHSGLSSRTIDVVIAHGFDRRCATETLPLWRDRIVVAMAGEHPLAGRKKVDLADLAQETTLINSQSMEFWTLCGIGTDAVLPSIVRHDVSRSSLLNLVRKGIGVTLLPDSDAASLIEGVVSSVLTNKNKSVRLRYDAHWRSDNSNPVSGAFVAFLRETYPQD
ncbi:LysR family transcriptional regulator [Aminobacter aganoensis]|uniref:DNA-binding transcriptional LysR family regulator n=1 Tax=Aminobacter aganoensis TaxID=83264 RepID=A0A7X0FCM4_9HYPH|nr:LysR substrate-binding domain-containing protein [Aminobacter aganoensis]MBB6357236.1 DNA-binding transcriptional LysR family regulator [Aminobacter aganoensis]